MSTAANTNEALSREIRRLTQKLHLANVLAKRGELVDPLSEKVSILEPAALRVPVLERRISDLELELSLANSRSHAAGALAASMRKRAIQIEADTSRSLVEAERRQISCEKTASIAATLSAAGVRDAQIELLKVKGQLDDMSAKYSLDIANFSTKIEAVEKEAQTWKTFSAEAERKLVLAEGKIQANAVNVAGFGNTFSPAPLALNTVLGHPANLTPVKDLASESRSRFTSTTPFENEESGPPSMPTSVADDQKDGNEVSGKEKAGRGRTQSRAVSSKQTVRAKRPRGRPRKSPAADASAGGLQTKLDPSTAAGKEDLAEVETETESEDVRGANVRRGGTRLTNAERVAVEDDVAGQGKVVDQEEDEKAGSRRRGTSPNATKTGDMKTMRKGVRKAAVSKREKRGAIGASSKKHPFASKEPDVDMLDADAPKRLDGRSSRRRKPVSYGYSIQDGADINFEMEH